MDIKQSVSPAVIAAAIVLLLGVVGFMAMRSFGSNDGGSAPGGAAARTEAPQVQRYQDGTVVPYDAAPAGVIPGDPTATKR